MNQGIYQTHSQIFCEESQHFIIISNRLGKIYSNPPAINSLVLTKADNQ